MADLKTKENDGDVIAYLSKVQPDAKREDCMALLDMMCEATSEEAHMWGSSIVGFGKYHYRYASGHEGE